MTRADLDDNRMGEALALARTAIGQTEPNPRVGCVLGTADGIVLGTGVTQHAGGRHAEIMALQDARSRGLDVTGATAWVTLEPCAQHGRTPPCCDALISAGLGRVVVAVQDPFSQVSGAGIARMRAAGIRVDMADVTFAQAAWDLNVGFFSRIQRGRPWVRLKIAASLDGRTALDNGASQWITGAAARADGHRWRHRASAVLTGVGTVLADDPRLDARVDNTTFNPLRVVVDSKLRTPPKARLLHEPGVALIVTNDSTSPNAADLQTVAEVIAVPGADGRVDLGALFVELARRQINEVHVEAGQQLTTALLTGGLVDELLMYVAPRILGVGRGLVNWPPLQSLGHGLDLEFLDVTATGEDLRLRLRPVRALRFGPTGPAECR